MKTLYKLCKEAKDAGLAQKGNGEFISSRHTKYSEILKEEVVENLYIPTLEEALEWCGDDFKKLWRHSNSRYTASAGTLTERSTMSKEGETPLEAVLKLGIKLHK